MEGMRTGFGGFPPQARQFLRALHANNRRDWFRPRKAEYERYVREPLFELGNELGRALQRHSPEPCFDPRRSVYRIYRDVRFSKNKDPYKTNAAVVFPPSGLGRHAGASFYFHFSADELLVGGGLYRPTSDSLRRIRAKIADDPGSLRAILADANFRASFGEMSGDRLKSVPRGYARNHPAADLLAYKQYLAGATLPAKVIERPTVVEVVDQHFRAMAPLVSYLTRAIQGG